MAQDIYISPQTAYTPPTHLLIEKKIKQEIVTLEIRS